MRAPRQRWRFICHRCKTAGLGRVMRKMDVMGNEWPGVWEHVSACMELRELGTE